MYNINKRCNLKEKITKHENDLLSTAAYKKGISKQVLAFLYLNE